MAMGSRGGTAVHVDFGEGNQTELLHGRKTSSMQGKWAGLELHIKTESIAMLGGCWMCSQVLIPCTVHN